jgi:hypothetical protein
MYTEHTISQFSVVYQAFILALKGIIYKEHFYNQPRNTAPWLVNCAFPLSEMYRDTPQRNLTFLTSLDEIFASGYT